MRKRFVVLVLISALALTVFGCGKPPTEEVEAAKAAVEAARDSGAEMYAPAPFSEATKDLASAESSVTIKKYDDARNFALQAKQKAERAQQLAIKNKAAAKAKAQDAVANAEGVVNTAAEALATAPKGKGTEEDIQQLNYDLEQAKSLLQTARQKMASEDYYAASDNAQKASETASGIQEAVETAKQTRTAGKPLEETEHETDYDVEQNEYPVLLPSCSPGKHCVLLQCFNVPVHILFSLLAALIW